MTEPELAGEAAAIVLQTAGVRAEMALRTAGQRAVNLLWEKTQMKIAFIVVAGVIAVQGVVVLAVLWVLVHHEGKLPPELLTFAGGVLAALESIMSLVIGFYFGRTNHQKVGGVGYAEEGR